MAASSKPDTEIGYKLQILFQFSFLLLRLFDMTGLIILLPEGYMRPGFGILFVCLGFFGSRKQKEGTKFE